MSHWVIRKAIRPGRRSRASIWEPGDLLRPIPRAMENTPMAAITTTRPAAQPIHVPAWAFAVALLAMSLAATLAACGGGGSVDKGFYGIDEAEPRPLDGAWLTAMGRSAQGRWSRSEGANAGAGARARRPEAHPTPATSTHSGP